MPQSIDDYGDFDPSASRQAKQTESEESDDDPIGDLFGDILAGAGSLIDELGGIVGDVTNGNVSNRYNTMLITAPGPNHDLIILDMSVFYLL